MNLENARATLGLTARSEMTAPGTSSSERQLIGLPVTEVDFSDADIIYSFQVTSTGSSDAVSLNLATGVVSSTTGTPTITDAGEDFEGGALPTAVRILAVAGVTPSSNTGLFIAASGSNTPFAQSLRPGSRAVVAQEQTSPGTLNLSFYASGDVITLTILGKSS